MSKNIIIVGSGNAALTAGIAALEKGANVLIIEKGNKELAGGNTKYTAGAMRFSYENGKELYRDRLYGGITGKDSLVNKDGTVYSGKVETLSNNSTKPIFKFWRMFW